MNQERNEKIRKQWLEQIELNERAFAKQLTKENLPFEKFLELEKVQKEGQELKKRIEDGHIPDEPPVSGYKCVDGQFVTMTEEEGDEFIDKEKTQPMPKIQKQQEGGNQIMGRICKLFSRK
jgi:hypothetical protein